MAGMVAASVGFVQYDLPIHVYAGLFCSVMAIPIVFRGKRAASSEPKADGTYFLLITVGPCG